MVKIKTIEECKNEVAVKHKYTTFYQMLVDGGIPMTIINERIDEVVNLYAQQFQINENSTGSITE
jgi:hypothetical protein